MDLLPKSMISHSGSLSFPVALPHSSTVFTSGYPSWGSNLVHSFGCKKRKKQKRFVCGCVAPPWSIGSVGHPATKFNDTYQSQQLSTIRETMDDSSVLIECRDVYKSFGEKHILRGVSFKNTHDSVLNYVD